MHLLLHYMESALVAMFAVGVVGSSLVIAISFVEDFHELFSRTK